jgi:hypothetical protein
VAQLHAAEKRCKDLEHKIETLPWDLLVALAASDPDSRYEPLRAWIRTMATHFPNTVEAASPEVDRALARALDHG